MKTELRKKMLKLRQEFDVQKNTDYSKIISKKLTDLIITQDVQRIMAYHAFKGEVDLQDFLDQCFKKGKQVYLPRILSGGIMQASEYKKDSDMIRNKYGIQEPQSKATEKSLLDVIIVPALAFDKKLYRLGYGGGYYDRFLRDTNAVKIGVCFDFQIVENIQSEEHDVSLDIVISEKRILGELL